MKKETKPEVKIFTSGVKRSKYPFTEVEVLDSEAKRKKFQRAYETDALVEKLLVMKEDEQVTYKELSDIAHGDVSYNGDKANFLVSARYIVKKDKGYEFKAIHNVGLRRMTTSEKVTKYSRFNHQIVKKSRAGMISMSMLSPSDYNKLSEEDKVKYNTAFTMLNAHRKYGSPEVVHKVEKAIKERKEPLALKEFIKEFNKKNHSK